jgi:hypothetical protein
MARGVRIGRPRSRNPKDERVQFRISLDWGQRLKEMAKRYDIGKNEMARMMLLAQLSKDDDEKKK